MTTTISKPQKLETKDDLELLVGGDTVVIKREMDKELREALYWGRNAKQEFIFLIRENDDKIKRIVTDKDYMKLSEEGILIVKPLLEFSHRKYEPSYSILDDNLSKAGL